MWTLCSKRLPLNFVLLRIILRCRQSDSARKVGHQQLRDYLIISAYGLVLIFDSDEAVILSNRPYLHFSMVTFLFLGLSAYLVLVWIYSSATSISGDSKLRQSIRGLAVRESRFLESIGSGIWLKKFGIEVLTLTKLFKVQMAEESGIQTSVTDDEMKEYLD